MNKHTPGPWVIRPMGLAHDEGFTIERVDSGLRSVIAELRENWLCPEHGGNGIQANAEFIVRACNSYDDMLAALQQAQGIAQRADDGEYDHLSRLLAKELYAFVTPAIAKAKGE